MCPTYRLYLPFVSLVLCRRFSLVIYFIHKSIPLLIPTSQFIPSPLPPKSHLGRNFSNIGEGRCIGAGDSFFLQITPSLGPYYWPPPSTALDPGYLHKVWNVLKGSGVMAETFISWGGGGPQGQASSGRRLYSQNRDINIDRHRPWKSGAK